MFGYVKPCKPQLRICEYDTYKAVYCGLCGQLGKSFGPAARLTLSYDFVFLSMLHMAMTEQSPVFTNGRCYVNKFKKVPVCGECPALSFSADVAALMIYYKLLDNIEDEGFLARTGWRSLRPVVAAAHRKAAERLPECDALIAESMQNQRALELAKTASVDAAAEPTAQAMASICQMLSADPNQRRILERLGYLTGRYVYLCDALDDLEEDVKRGGYNPFALRYGLNAQSPAEEREKAYGEARSSLYATIAEADKALDLLNLLAYRPILENVLQAGMRLSVDEILAKKEKIR